MSDNINHVKNIGWITALLLSLAFVAYTFGYRLNASSSYPPGIYQLQTFKSAYRVKDLILFCPPNNLSVSTAKERGYIAPGRCQSGTVPMIKRIVAAQGDKITLVKTININGTSLDNAPILQKDSLQRPLTAFQLNDQFQFVVPRDQFFVSSEYAPRNSFDSRYFGLISSNMIQGTIKPVLLF